MLFGPAFAARDPLVKAMGTLGLALILLGTMYWIWPVGTFARSLILPTTNWGFQVDFLNARLNGTQLIAFGFALFVTVATILFLRFTKLGTATRALADDREIAATLGVPVRRVEAAAWLGSGLVCGASGPAAREPRRPGRGFAHLPRHLGARRGPDRPPPVARG